MRGGAQTEDGAANGNRALEIALPPDFDRIALQSEENRERPSGPRGPARIRRYEGPRGYGCKRHRVRLRKTFPAKT